jgi:hypothetical protein
LGIADSIIAEPLGGAHRNIHDAVYNVEQYITRTLRELKRMNIENLLENRYQKLRAIGTSATTFKPLSDSGEEIKAAAEKIIQAGQIKPPQTKPVEV